MEFLGFLQEITCYFNYFICILQFRRGMVFFYFRYVFMWRDICYCNIFGRFLQSYLILRSWSDDFVDLEG